MLQLQLQETIASQTEAEKTLASYGVMETEWKNHHERLEEQIKEMEEIVVQRDQELAEHVATKEQLLAELEEKSESFVCVCVCV